jgi:MoaA/NifB/PqqE/SkfB family radical SAM enzyme
VQCGLSGGEPLVRDDLELIVAEAHRLGYYTNLLTSGVGLTEARRGGSEGRGLDHVQLSFQDSTREMNDFLSHTKTFELKNRVAKIIKDQGWPMVMNVVIHRLNIDHIDRIIGMARSSVPSTSSWRTRSTTRGLTSTATSCCRRTSSCAARDGDRRLARQTRRAHAHLLRGTRLSRGHAPRSASTAGATCSLPSRRTAPRCPATPPRCCRD